MKFQKIMLLFLALLLPVIIFIFLKSFGKNKFDVAPLFQEVVEIPADCSVQYKFPYTIPDTVLAKFSWSHDDSLALIVFDDALDANGQKTSIQLSRLNVELKRGLNYIVYAEHYRPEQGLHKNSISVVEIISNQLSTLKKCIFLVKANDNAILVDSKGRIRGQYNLTDMEDSDRLIMELKIILKNY
jgi:protein SCO1/2